MRSMLVSDADRASSIRREHMIVRTFVQLAAAAGILTVVATSAHAEGASIFQATLAETGQKTGEVSTEQLRQILTDGSAIVLDTRPRVEFDAGHIPGAHVLDVAPHEQTFAAERLANGNKEAGLVIYCNGPYCQASRRLADQLTAAGFTNVRRYQLGMPVWRALGGPTVVELDGVRR